MTEKIYYTDPYCKIFEAAVLSCIPCGNHGWEIILDRTAFYPEGGGQPGDRGTISGITVTDTHIKNGEIIHYAEAPVEVGSIVTGEIDWDYRFDLMQNHSGEHILSGIIHADLGANNVGFHMGSDLITVDVDQMIPPEKLPQYEMLANEAVWKNIETQITYPDTETLQTLDYRSKKELSGDVRIVAYPDYDTCACCALHVKNTGAIGLIKLISVQKHKSGSRIEMVCGKRALRYVNNILEQNHIISVALSAKPEETSSAVVRLKNESAQLTLQLSETESMMFAIKADTYKNKGDVLIFEDNLNPFSIRKLCVTIMEICGGRCAVFSGNDVTGYKYAIGEKDGNLMDFVKQMNHSLSGRGGGKPFLSQGSVTASREQIECFFAEN